VSQPFALNQPTKSLFLSRGTSENAYRPDDVNSGEQFIYTANGIIEV